MEESPMNAVGLNGSGELSFSLAREVRSSVDSFDEDGSIIRPLSTTAPPLDPVDEDGTIITSSSSARSQPPDFLSETSTFEDRLSSLELERAAVDQEIESLKLKRAALDQEIVGVKRQIAAKNPFMRALGIAPEAMFTFLNMWDANTLKLVSKLAREDVRNAFWSVNLSEMVFDKRQHVPARTTCTSAALVTWA